jgi:diguanylate cyclase (GGDEF)-like protein/PAS domain S-box-containing protein
MPKIKRSIGRSPRRAALQVHHLEAAMDCSRLGFCLFDADDRLIFSNRRCRDMFEPATAPGTTPPLSTAGGGSAGARPLAEMLRSLVEGGPAEQHRRLADGRVIAIARSSRPEGGWVATLEDVTHREHDRSELSGMRVALAEARAEASGAAAAARAAHQRVRDAIEHLPEAIVFFDAQERYVLWNRRYAELYADIADLLAPGVPYADILRASVDRGDMPEVAKDAEAWIDDRLRKLRHPGPPEEEQYTGGRWIRHEERRTADGGTISIRIDITELKSRERSFRLLFEENPVPMWVYDVATLRFLAVNNAAVEQYGYSGERFLTMSLGDIVRPEVAAPLLESAEESSDGGGAAPCVRHVRADGSAIEAMTYTRSLVHGDRAAALMAIVDMTERKQAERRLTHLAHHDALTDLPNRTALTERLARALRDHADGAGFALLRLDLDGFEDTNDIFGHAVGDELLRIVGRRLRAAADGVFLARVGGNEFTAICNDGRPEHAAALAERLRAAACAPAEIDGRLHRLGLSIGIGLCPQHGTDAITLLGNADAALHRAMADGRLLTRFFEPATDGRWRERHALQHRLRSAAIRSQLLLHYQPQAKVSGGVFGFEALVRWQHPEQGLIAPDQFIPLAEENGQIVEVGEWVLREACRVAAAWPMPLQIAVNLSPVQFRLGDLPTLIHAIMIETGLSPDRLELEITEGVLITDPPRALSILRRLKTIGVRIAMDDFGTGYSSLSSLQSFPFDKIKIDRSLVSSITASEQSAAIVRAAIALGRALEMPVLAEGVETEKQRELLRRERCHEIQGFLIGRPQPIASYAHITHGHARIPASR